MLQAMRLHSQAQAAGYSCVGYVQMLAVKWYVVYTSLASQLGFRRTVVGRIGFADVMVCVRFPVIFE